MQVMNLFVRDFFKKKYGKLNGQQVQLSELYTVFSQSYWEVVILIVQLGLILRR